MEFGKYNRGRSIFMRDWGEAASAGAAGRAGRSERARGRRRRTGLGSARERRRVLAREVPSCRPARPAPPPAPSARPAQPPRGWRSPRAAPAATPGGRRRRLLGVLLSAPVLSAPASALATELPRPAAGVWARKFSSPWLSPSSHPSRRVGVLLTHSPLELHLNFGALPPPPFKKHILCMLAEWTYKI